MWEQDLHPKKENNKSGKCIPYRNTQFPRAFFAMHIYKYYIRLALQNMHTKKATKYTGRKVGS